MYAIVGDFTLSASGDVQIAGGSIKAAGNVVVAAAGFNAATGTNGKPTLTIEVCQLGSDISHS